MKNNLNDQQPKQGRKGGQSYYYDDVLILEQLRNYYKGKTQERRKN